MAHYIFSSHKKGISSHQLAKDITVTQKSAWFILHRLRNAYDHPNFKKITHGITEIDETFYGGNETNKHKDKKTFGAHGGKTKKPVLGMLQRNGNLIATVVDQVNGSTIKPIIYNAIPEKSVVITDEWQGYKGLGKTHYHFTVNHSAKQYVNGLAHTNSIENFWSHMKRGIDGIYHSVSFKHLQSYVNEYALRFNTRKQDTAQRFNLTLSNVDGKKLTYKLLTKKDGK